MADYELRTATVADAASLANNNMRAFWGEPGWRILYMQEDGTLVISLEDLIERAKIRTPYNLIKDPVLARHQVIIHVPTGEVVGYARWQVPVTHKDMWADAKVPEVPEDEKNAYQETFKRMPLPLAKRSDDPVPDDHYAGWKEKYGPFVPYMKLEYLATRPDHQRQGLAGKLVEAGLDEAARVNIPVSIYSSTKRALPLYQKLGCVLYDEKTVDLQPFGVDGSYDTAYLVKAAPKPL